MAIHIRLNDHVLHGIFGRFGHFIVKIAKSGLLCLLHVILGIVGVFPVSCGRVAPSIRPGKSSGIRCICGRFCRRVLVRSNSGQCFRLRVSDSGNSLFLRCADVRQSLCRRVFTCLCRRCGICGSRSGISRRCSRICSILFGSSRRRSTRRRVRSRLFSRFRVNDYGVGLVCRFLRPVRRRFGLVNVRDQGCSLRSAFNHSLLDFSLVYDVGELPRCGLSCSINNLYLRRKVSGNSRHLSCDCERGDVSVNRICLVKNESSVLLIECNIDLCPVRDRIRLSICKQFHGQRGKGPVSLYDVDGFGNYPAGKIDRRIMNYSC